ncbi:hypothetical protein KSP39_PZI024298 [Platanthera zijinensis]|uniref:Uncharacterized protein n=1 Tax=Platanthera zijinensis TaxID=2320716 RepID=A0AAP0FU01_9ASPA
MEVWIVLCAEIGGNLKPSLCFYSSPTFILSFFSFVEKELTLDNLQLCSFQRHSFCSRIGSRLQFSVFQITFLLPRIIGLWRCQRVSGVRERRKKGELEKLEGVVPSYSQW